MLFHKQNNKIPKKVSQKLSKFSYYVDTYFPDLFQLTHKTLDLQKKVERPQNQLLSKTTDRNITYNYFYSDCQNSALIDTHSILGSVKKLYLNQDVIKINDLSYSRQSIFKHSYLPSSGYFSEIIDFVLLVDEPRSQMIQKCQQQGESKALLQKSRINKQLQSEQSKTAKTLHKPKEYQLYVIHNCNSFKVETQNINKISWQYFIERYHFTEKNLTDPSSVSTIKYELVCSHKVNSSLFSLEDKLTRKFIESHCKLMGKNTLENLQKLQGYLLLRSAEVEANKKKQNDVAFSNEHRRQTKMPIQHFKHYIALKKEIYKYYVQFYKCESQLEINKYYYENLICRYLIAKEYNFEQAKKSIIDYIKWQKQMKEKYPSIQCFKEIHQEGAYRYIGEDFMGRPVVLSKSALVDVNKMKDVEKYCDYYIYFLQIYLPTKMRGYVDQMIAIGDLINLGTNNFKLAITKRNIADSLKYSPERQLSMYIVNASTFAYTAWTFIKPLLPKKSIHKIQILGSDKKQIVDSIGERMDVSVIPEYLGGNNKHIKSDLMQDEQEQVQFENRSKTQLSENKIKKTVSRLMTKTSQEQMKKLEMKTMQSSLSAKKQTNRLIQFLESVTATFGIKFSG